MRRRSKRANRHLYIILYNKQDKCYFPIFIYEKNRLTEMSNLPSHIASDLNSCWSYSKTCVPFSVPGSQTVHGSDLGSFKKIQIPRSYPR